MEKWVSMNNPFDVVLKHVQKKFGDFVAVRDFNLNISKGEYICMLGPSGCGKTTTLRMIAGHEEPTSGEIYIGGRRVNDLAPVERGTTTMFQSFALFPHMNVLENVEFGLKMNKISRRERHSKVEEMLKRVGLTQFRYRKPHELSGGQQQRVALARALVTEPSVLLLDEPMGSLDELLRVHMRGELKLLQRRVGLTFIHVTHNQDECLCMGDRLVVMADGVIEQIGTPYEVYCKPQSLFVAEFIGDNNIFMGRIASKEKGKSIIDTDYGRFLVQTDRPIPEPGEAVSFCVRADSTSVREGDDLRENRILARVRFIEYLGFYIKLRLELEDGKEIFAKESQTRFFQDPLKEGDKLSVRWSAENAVLLSGHESGKKLYI
jgi:putative spermidine/putrescine transport system ATP-binding protein